MLFYAPNVLLNKGALLPYGKKKVLYCIKKQFSSLNIPIFTKNFLHLQNITQITHMRESLFSEMPAFVVLFWLILFFLIKEKKTGQRFFILFLAVTLVNYVIYWCYFNINYQYYYFLDSLWILTSQIGRASCRERV